jgi:hypothetical protein
MRNSKKPCLRVSNRYALPQGYSSLNASWIVSVIGEIR